MVSIEMSRLPPREIIKRVAGHFGMTSKALIDAGRVRSRNRVVRVRAITAWMLRRGAIMSLQDIGQELGGRHHTTVMAWLAMKDICRDAIKVANSCHIDIPGIGEFPDQDPNNGA